MHREKWTDHCEAEPGGMNQLPPRQQGSSVEGSQPRPGRSGWGGTSGDGAQPRLPGHCCFPGAGGRSEAKLMEKFIMSLRDN